ncbi:MAG: FkbM family methyltransferase [Acidimicrobiia bacterium]
MASFARAVSPLLAAAAAMKVFQRRVDVGEMTLLVSALDLSVGRGLIRDRIWEAASTKVFKSIVHPGDTVVDIGAHLGYFTIMASKAVGNDGRVHAFEPDRRSRALLAKNIEANQATNVALLPYAIGNTTANQVHRLNAAAPLTRLDTVRLDDYFEPGDTVDVVKLDIDGGEIEALDGMRRLVRTSPHVHLLIEHDPWQQRVSNRSTEELHHQLASLGFVPVVSIDEASGEIRDVDWSTPDLGSKTVNLLLLKEDDSGR